MSRKRYSPEKIIGRLREAEVALSQGLTVGQICRQLSISEQTYYRWCKQYGGLKISQAKKAFHRVNILTVTSGCHFSIRHINQKAWIDINRSRFFFGLYHILGG